MDVPEIDGAAYVKIKDGEKIDENLVGQYIKCRVKEVKNYDIICEKMN